MPILFCAVARVEDAAILAKYASCRGNFAEVAEQIFAKISPQDNKLTYSEGAYLYHFIAENRIVYFCITDDEFQRARAFLFLNEVKRRFVAQYGATAATAIPYAMNSDFSRILANEMRHYSESRDLDTISRVHGELDELKDIVVQNINKLTDREEHLKLLVEKTENLTNNSVSFRSRTRVLQRTMWWKNVKMYFVVGGVALAALYLLLAAACGFRLNKC